MLDASSSFSTSSSITNKQQQPFSPSSSSTSSTRQHPQSRGRQQRAALLQAGVVSLIIYVFFTSNLTTRGAESQGKVAYRLLDASNLPSSTTLRGSQEAMQTCDRTQCRERFYDGHWVHRPNRTRNEFAYLYMDAYGCGEVDFRKLYPERTKHQVHNQYDWDTGSGCCAIHQFDASHFCDILEGLDITSIMVVGDSLSNLFAVSLHHMMHAEGQPNWRRGPFIGTICDSRPKPVRFSYIRNDLLYTEDHVIEKWNGHPQSVNDDKLYTNWPVNQPWTPYVDELKPDLLILNAGPHIHHPDLHDEVMRRLTDYLKDNYHGRLVWRTTFPGHPRCGEYFNKGPELNESKVWEYTGAEADLYTWHLQDGYNDVAVPLMRSLGAEIIHGDRIVRLRADGHANPGGDRDCYHYFAPGPQDWWVVALYQHMEADYFKAKQERGEEVTWEPVIVDDNLQ